MATGEYDIGSIVKFQRCWRKFVQKETLAHHIMTLCGTYGFTEERMKTTRDMEDMKNLLRDVRVVEQIGLILQYIHFVSGRNNYIITDWKTRVFLAMPLIMYRTSEVFEEMDFPLLKITTKLLTMFHEICGPLHKPTLKLIQAFPSTLKVYMENFKRWKAKDGAKLKCRIRHALVALYQAQEEVHKNEGSNYLETVNEQIAKMRVKLFNLAGQDGVDQFDIDHPSGSFTSINPIITSSSTTSASDDSGHYFTNEQLTHEMLLNPNFKFNDDDSLIAGSNVQNPLFARMRENFQSAFWACLEDELNLEQPFYGRVLKVVGEIREGLKVLTGYDEAVMSEMIDVEFIKGRIDTDSFSFSDTVSMFTRIVNIIKRIQAPERKEEMDAKWAEMEGLIKGQTTRGGHVICKCLEFFLGRINVMRTDMSNARFRMIMPTIAENGIKYETDKYEDMLKAGTITDTRVKEWLGQTLKSFPVLAQQIYDGSRMAAVELHAAGMLSIISESSSSLMLSTSSSSTGFDSISSHRTMLPETLRLDCKRLALLKSEMSDLISIKAAHMMVYGVTKDVKIADSVCVTDAVGLMNVPDKFKPYVLEILKPDNGVRVLLRTRAEVFLRQCIVHCEDNVPAVVEDLFPNTGGKMPKVFVERATNLVKMLCRVAVLNRQVHVAVYNRIIHSLLGISSSGSAAAGC